MIQMQTCMTVADNSGTIIHIMGKAKKQKHLRARSFSRLSISFAYCWNIIFARYWKLISKTLPERSLQPSKGIWLKSGILFECCVAWLCLTYTGKALNPLRRNAFRKSIFATLSQNSTDFDKIRRVYFLAALFSIVHISPIGRQKLSALANNYQRPVLQSIEPYDIIL